MHFQIWSVHHVNKLRVKQCSHHWQWEMVNHVDIAADTQSDLPEAEAWRPKLQMTNSVTTTQSQYYYSLQLNKQMARYQTIFIPSDEVQEATQAFLFFLGGCRDTNRGDNSSLSSEGDSSHYSCKCSFTLCLRGQHLGGRKDIKAFSQSWQKNTGKWVDPAVLTRSDTGSVPCFHAELRCCDGQTAGSAQSFSRLTFISCHALLLLL